MDKSNNHWYLNIFIAALFVTGVFSANNLLNASSLLGKVAACQKQGKQGTELQECIKAHTNKQESKEKKEVKERKGKKKEKKKDHHSSYNSGSDMMGF